MFGNRAIESPIRSEHFCINIQSQLVFPPDVIRKALRTGLQDYMQDNNLNADVTIKVVFDYKKNAAEHRAHRL